MTGKHRQHRGGTQTAGCGPHCFSFDVCKLLFQALSPAKEMPVAQFSMTQVFINREEEEDKKNKTKEGKG